MAPALIEDHGGDDRQPEGQAEPGITLATGAENHLGQLAGGPVDDDHQHVDGEERQVGDHAQEVKAPRRLASQEKLGIPAARASMAGDIARPVRIMCGVSPKINAK